MSEQGRMHPTTQPVTADPEIRPMSWHPSSVKYQRQSSASLDVPSRHSLAAYQTVDVNGMATPMTQAESNPDAPEPWFHSDNMSTLYPSLGSLTGYGSASMRLNTSFENDLSFENNPDYALSTCPAMDDYSTFPSSTYSTQAWTESLSRLSAYTAPPTPDVLPLQNYPSTLQADNHDVEPMPKDDGKELIGMGLYNDPDRISSLFDGSTRDSGTFLLETFGSTRGKGLKLEEMWEPPEETEGSEDDQDEEAEGDEADEEEEKEGHESGEEDTTVQSTRQAGSNFQEKAIFAPSQQDLSNRSFFDGEEGHLNAGGSVQQQLLSASAGLPMQGVMMNTHVWR